MNDDVWTKKARWKKSHTRATLFVTMTRLLPTKDEGRAAQNVHAVAAVDRHLSLLRSPFAPFLFFRREKYSKKP